MERHIRLGVNIDHVATIRNARGGTHPDPVRAARLAVDAGAEIITAHLREDRRHIIDDDIAALVASRPAPINLEIAATAEMLEIAARFRPYAVCLVPERRMERTTEGGLNAAAAQEQLRPYVARLKREGLRVSLFIEAASAQVEAAAALGADAVEFHTGRYCDAATDVERASELTRIAAMAARAQALGLECHAGHGLTFATVAPIAGIAEIVELNIGHFLVGEAVFCGLAESVRTMRALMSDARLAAQTAP